MGRFLRRTFIFLLLLTLAAGGVGYYYGLRPDNYQEFFADLKDKVLGGNADSPFEVGRSNDREGKNTDQTSKPTASSVSKQNFSKVDRHAHKTPRSAEKDIGSLAAYLAKGAKSDLEKARAIFIWLTDNIRYDDDEYNNDSGEYPYAEVVLKKRKAVCEGFANLYLALGKEMGLEIEKVSGYSKGYSFTPGKRLNDTDHAWNIIRIDGKWRVFDATWGEGYGETVNGRLVTKKKFEPFWFNTDPYAAIFDHLPEDPEKAFVEPAISLREYEKMPRIDKGYFKFGFDPRQTYRDLRKDLNLEFPKAYSFDHYAKVRKAPRFAPLEVGQSYDFEVYIPKAKRVALIGGEDDWTMLKGEKGVFRGRVSPQKSGKLSLGADMGDKDGSFSTLLKYPVKKGRKVGS